jgi:C4-dicarboxylate-specific signal transduction histidine kinase
LTGFQALASLREGESSRLAREALFRPAPRMSEQPVSTIESGLRLDRRQIAGYGIALLSVSAAFVSTMLLQHLFPYPFLFLFFGAVMASAWFGGTAAGLFAVLLSTAVVAYYFVPPFYSWTISATAEAYFVSFVVCALVASWVSSSKKKSEEALRQTRDQLEIRVSERTAELMKTQAELAHLSRVLSMGELTASIAHELSQPLTAVVAHGNACVEWLSAAPPNLEKARQTAERIVRDGTRAGAVLSRIRALFKKEAPAKDWFDLNEAIHELTIFLRDEALRHHISIRTDLAPDLPKIKADRVQLQQVVLNLMMNGMDAMAEVTGARDLIVSSRQENSAVLVTVEDCGFGLDAEAAGKIFDPFFTTKSHGIGMGLSISRSIVESHEGRLWALPRPSGGAIFQFTLPIRPQDSDG